MDGDVPNVLSRIALSERADGRFGALAAEGASSRRLTYFVEPSSPGMWALVAEAAR
jgi:hypothetical protein